MILPTVFAVLLLATCLLAGWRGGAPERIVAGAYLAAWLASMFVESRTASEFLNAQPAIVTIDGLLFLLLMAVSLRANRYWPMVAASMQLIILMAHVFRTADDAMLRVVYAVITWMWPFLQLAILLAGTLFHWQRVIRRGADPDWSRSSTGSSPGAPKAWPSD